jgi:parallel beta-helix repeat protein
VDGGVWANNGGPAIWFDYQNANFLVKNTEVYGNHGWTQGWAGCGIVSEINGYNAPAGIIENNYVHDNSGDGIAIWESLRNVVRGNTLVRDTIGWRDMTNRAPYRTRDNTVIANRFFQGQVNPAPANANNSVTGTIQLPAAPGAPTPDPTIPPAQPGLPVGAVEIGMDNAGNVWHLAAGVLWKEGVEQKVTATPGVAQAIIGAAGFIIQQTKGGAVWTEVGDEQPAVHEVDVGLNAGETTSQGVEQRARMFIIVVRVGREERSRPVVRRDRTDRCPRNKKEG